ncbi:unnamed protein product [Amoebophrya sp. A25]|nr:unnamed protein product [Amoebophrya sp. A25]|eukprot:GSA25T00025269001.1
MRRHLVKPMSYGELSCEGSSLFDGSIQMIHASILFSPFLLGVEKEHETKNYPQYRWTVISTTACCPSATNCSCSQHLDLFGPRGGGYHIDKNKDPDCQELELKGSCCHHSSSCYQRDAQSACRTSISLYKATCCTNRNYIITPSGGSTTAEESRKKMFALNHER